MNLSILNLNFRIVVVSIIFVLVYNLFFCNNWPIVDITILIPFNYSESTINNDIINSLQDTGFRFFLYINFAAYCSTDNICAHPYNIQGSIHIIVKKSVRDVSG